MTKLDPDTQQITMKLSDLAKSGLGQFDQLAPDAKVVFQGRTYDLSKEDPEITLTISLRSDQPT